MSYSIQEAKHDQDQMIMDAIAERDSEKLFQLADIVKEQGDDEVAETLLKQAKDIERDDWAYDEFKDNNL